VPVFYEVRKESLHLYADFGLTFVKLGEEGRVPLEGFGLEGSANKEYRQAVRRLEREGCTFRIVPAAEVPALMPTLRAVSDEWLKSKSAAEKSFSLGCFDETYLTHFPAALIEREGEVEAFATVWPGPPGTEASVDLMRYREGARGTMDALFVHMMLWARQQGYRWFSLGMAPLAGLEASTVAPLWVKLGAFLYRHGEAFYNFQGLRAYKEKYNPVWEPHYLAYPGGLSLPRILADISALIAGGYMRIVRK
jgi:phosphatidylglycerol lysyltransferase